MERRREIGIRMALGAARGKIVAELARDAAIRVGLGVVVGAVLAGIGGRMLHGLLYGVTSGSPIMVAATLALLLFVVALAFVVPAERAASVNPMESIRQE
jgi:ABC-type antimicrobial peptide transport system permease subunit